MCCHYCKKEGHLIRDCWFKRKKEERDTKVTTQNSTSNLTQAFVGVSSLINCADEITALVGQSWIAESDWIVELLSICV